MYEHMRQDDRDVETIIAEGRWPPNPVVTKGLVQVTMGSPQPVYNGGLLRGMVRYFDQEQHKPGLPQDVAALVDEVAADKVGVQLVNLSANKARTVIVQAGAYGEHSFTQAHWREQDHEEIKHVEKTVSVDGKHISVHLPPGTSIRLDLGVKRFAQSPSYAQPWHGGELKIY
jgi:hypothetical protein